MGKQTPLMSAVLAGKEKALVELLKNGASTTIGEKDGYTPMHGAAFQGRPKILKLLYAHGVPLDEVHADGFRPIQRACWGRVKKHSETVAAFLELGVRLDHAKDCRTDNKDTLHVLRDFQIPGTPPPDDHQSQDPRRRPAFLAESTEGTEDKKRPHDDGLPVNAAGQKTCDL